MYAGKVRRGLRAFNSRSVIDPGLFEVELYKKPDQHTYMLSLMNTLLNFLKADNYIMFLELYRKVTKS